MCIHRGHNADKKRRCGVNFTEDGIRVNCFNCFFYTKWYNNSVLSSNMCFFLKCIGVSEEDIKKIKFQAHREQVFGISFGHELNVESPTASWVEFDLPKDAMSLSAWADNGCNDKDFLKVCSYVLERKLDNFDKLFWTPEKENQLNRRVIIPGYFKGIVVGYSARYCSDNLNKKIPKYLNFFPENFVYNLDSQLNNDRKFCIVCEGMLDAYLVDGVSFIGNTVNHKQISLIKKLNKTVVLCPDRDDSGQPLIDIAVREGWFVSFPKWSPDIKDPADAVKKYGKILTLQTILKNREDNKLKIHVSRKLDNYGEK